MARQVRYGVMDRRTRHNHFLSAALPITDDLLRRSEPPLSANCGLMHRSKIAASFDHLVGAQQERLRDGQAERLGGG